MWKRLAGLAAVLALAVRILTGPRTVDDAFITFRYARNLLTGAGFVYNPGEQVLGTTTPLYTLLLAIIGLVTGRQDAPFPELAIAVNAVADAITVLLLFDLGRRLGASYAGLGAALVWAIAPFSVTFASGGLETSVFVLLLTGTANAYVRKNYPTAALAGGLALLTRPEALILLGPLAVDRLAVARRGGDDSVRWVEVLLFGIPLITWVIFSTSYFGSPLPHSISAKSLAYRLPPEAALVRLLQHYATPFLGHLTFGIVWIGFGLLIYPTLFLIGARHSLRESSGSWPILLFPWLYLAAFAMANPLIFRWYLTPPLPFYILTILVGLQKVAEQIQVRLDSGATDSGFRLRQLTQQAALVFLIVVAPVILSLRDWTLHPDHGLDRPAPKMAWYKLELQYREAAETLRPYLTSKTTLAASDVGVLGYYTTARILDTVGLNSPEALKYYPIDPRLYVINLATSPELIIDVRPEYLVLLEVYGREGLFKDERFWDSYSLMQTIESDVYGSDGMLVFSQTGS